MATVESSSTNQGGEAPRGLPARLLERLYAKARAGQWQLSPAQFAQALERSAEHYTRAGASATEPTPAAYLESLHLEDLALATACAEGNEAAWEHFVREFRPVLYAAARAIAGPGAGDTSRELADSLYADLFGLPGEGKERKSLFRYFHGRSKLSTWLRAVLAQRHVDAVRAARRTESLEEEDAQEHPRTGVRRYARTEGSAPDTERERYLALLQATLTQALAALEPRERLRLSYYYVQDLTLAQIGRLLGEHEATVSRKLDRTRRQLRKHVESALAEGPHRLSEAQVQLCFQYAQEEWPFDLTRVLSGAGPPGNERSG